MNLLSTALITASVVFSTVVPVYAQNTYPARNADVGGIKSSSTTTKLSSRQASEEYKNFFSRRKMAPSGLMRAPERLHVPSIAEARLAQRVAASKVKLRGAMTDNTLWYDLSGEKPYGIYELSTTPGTAEYKIVKADQRFYVMDAVYTGDKLWISHAIEDPSTLQVKSMTYYTFNPVTWEVLKEQVGDKELSLMTSTWSPQDEVAYCSWYGSSGFTFGCLAIEDGQLMSIGKLDKRLVAMAAHNDGTLYGIDESGALVTLNKQTGKVLKTIGNTGIVSYWRTSAAVDSQNNIMYYIDCGSSKSILYAVDLETAVATKVYDFANSEQLIGLYVVADDTPATVPAVPTDLALSFEGASLSGSISFAVPSTFYDGSTASGDVTYSVVVDEESPLTGSATWGQRCTVPVTVSSAGSHQFTVKLVNTTGNSPEARISGWIGPDAPAAVTGASATYANGKFTIKWDAPTGGANGGNIDLSQLRYKVVRTPGDVIVEAATSLTQITDEVPEPVNEIIGYTYTITPVCGESVGESVTTAKKSIGYFIPPYSNDFATSSKTAGYSVVDGNKDGKKWGYNSASKAMRIQYNSSKDMDDWVFTPALQLEAGRNYTFSFKARAHNNSDAERVEAAITTGTSASSVVEKIISATDITSKEWVTLSGSFIPTVSGRYRFALHAISPKNSYYLYATDIEVSAGAGTGAPAAVSDFTVTPAEDGSLKTSISMRTPSTDVSGAPISSIEKIELLRNGVLLETFPAPAVNTVITHTDNEAPAGSVVYSAIAYNAAGAGASAQASVFVGFAAPTAPTEISARIGDNTGKAVITWKAPETDINGRKLTSENVTYSILRKIDDKTTTIKTGLTECTFSDQAVAADADQDFIIYGVSAQTTGGSSDAVSTQLIPLGKPYATPFRESFANGTISSIWGLDSSVPTAGWLLGQDSSIDKINSEDNDNGLAIMEAMTKGSSATLYSGSIAIPTEGNPILCFSYFNHDSQNTLDVLVAETGETTGQKLTTVTLNPNAPEGWVNVPLDLSAYKGKNIQLYFTATVVNTTIFVLDNIRVECRLDNDLAIRGISMPARVAVGSDYEINVAFENKGLKAASGYIVDLILNGETVDSKSGQEIAPAVASSMAFSRRMLPVDAETFKYEVEIKYAADMNPADNRSEAYTIRRVTPDFPVPATPTATETDNGVELTWTEPDLTVTEMQPICDNAEDYTAFSTGLAGSVVFDDYIGDWTMIDYDGVVPFAITNEGKKVEFPNSGRPIGFMVFDSSIMNLQEWNAHSGKQMFVSFASGYAPNDDWMISPMLPGTAQTVKFWARSLTTQYGADSFQFLYSTTDTKLSSFTRVETVAEVPAEWKEYSFQIPEGARWFAIRCTSDQTFAFFVDDITYTPAHPADGLNLTGYNLYRNGKPLNESVLAVKSFVDHLLEDGDYKYQVTAVYNKGESALSAPASVKFSGVESILAGGKIADVYGVDGILIIRNASADDIKRLPRGIYIIDGKKIRI